MRHSSTSLSEGLLRTSRAPARLLLTVLLFSAAQSVLGLSVVAGAAFGSLERGIASVAIAWWLIRTIDLLAVELHPRLLHRGQRSLAPLIIALRQVAKVLILVFLAVTLLHTAGFDVTTLLAGLGIGGIAVALAAQKSIENLFGGVTLFLDRPVRIGDPCRFGDRVGTVEEIGLRSTRVRTPDRTLVVVPNSEFSSLQLENLGSRDKIWFHPTLSLRSDTRPDQMKHILSELTEMLAHYDRVESSSVSVRFVGFGAYSLNIDVSAYILTDDWSNYLTVAEDLQLRCMEIIERAGSGLAFSLPPAPKTQP
jgi:MscS family membrane protein